MNYWLSYGGGVNSTALAVLICEGKLPQFKNSRFLFSDTGEEKQFTYQYIDEVFRPYLKKHGRELEIVRPAESVLERWERLKVTGSRIIRACSVEGKIRPIEKHIAANGGGEQLIGIDAGELHRVKDVPGKHYPLVELDIDRKGCEKIIGAAGLPSPGKSGCWCCPFMRVSEVIALVKNEPCKFARIEVLELMATEVHGVDPHGNVRTHWGDKPASEWRERARQGDFFHENDLLEMPCECYDGGGE